MTRMPRRGPVLAASVLVCLLAGLLTSCSSIPAAGSPQAGSPQAGTPHDGTAHDGTAHDTLHGALTIYAAASLTASFDALAAGFEKRHPDVAIHPIDYGGSSTLATQIVAGAPADVFASADTATMNQVTEHGLAVGHPAVFATNTLEIAVAPGNPRHITSLADLARPGLQVLLCAPLVPCGAAAHTLLDAAGVHLTPASEEQNVTAVLSKVKAGEADAGLVYTTDVQASAGAVDGVAIPHAHDAVNRYPIAVLKGAANADAATAFVDYVRSAAGRRVLASYGFGAP